ncbi:hypothetical protein LPJ73_000592 [Coemansia sp. RSA 2703]|nr:hypothetical protein LPJ73_000592 [Coemansia sp. RSA 2703]KAJ2398130.1 hypothetical protein GGI05_000277 [Coemansia sp. RSA 2603]
MNNNDSNGNGDSNTVKCGNAGIDNTAHLTCGASSQSLSTGDADEDSGSSDNSHSTAHDNAARFRECVRQSAYIATIIVKQHSGASIEIPAFAESNTAHLIVKTLVNFIVKLGLKYPESGLVPQDGYGYCRMYDFLHVWSTNIAPLLQSGVGGCDYNCDLATLSIWIAMQRYRRTKKGGSFWNGRIPSAVEVVAAPFADMLLHSGIIPDTSEYSSLTTWLATVRTLPHLYLDTLN